MNDMEKNLMAEGSEDFAAMLEETMIKLRPGQIVKGVVAHVSDDGVIICDDTLFQGRPALEGEIPPRKHRTNTLALREFNEFVMTDTRFSSTHTAIGNGLTIIKPKKR
jgi:predicted O-methyltransferase YrrM